MDIEKFDEVKAELLHDNRPFIPNADIKHIGWLSRAGLTKDPEARLLRRRDYASCCNHWNSKGK
jgi:hypothetical protein